MSFSGPLEETYYPRSRPPAQEPRQPIREYAATPPQAAFDLLARGESLERRASRGYSAYHVAQMMGTSPGSVLMLPTLTPSAAPQIRESRESLDAIRIRDSTHRENVLPKTRTT